MITINETLSKLNQWEAQLERYTINCDNLYVIAQERKAHSKLQAPTQEQIDSVKVTDKELDAVHEYNLNYSDYYKIVKNLEKLIAKTILDSEEVIIYDGGSYRVKK
tara:strand:+ start:304 stop:621 length:318 start_codon:yes stop_codon:yes gene_type:complete